MKKTFWKRPSTWLGIGLSALVLVVAACSTGIGGVLIMGGLIGLGTGGYTLITRRGSWLALAGRKAGAGVAAGALIVTLVGCGVYGATGSPGALDPTGGGIEGTAAAPGDRESPSTSAGPSSAASAPAASTAPSVTASPSPTSSTRPSPPAPHTALALLETLAVKGRAPKTGYDRTAMFGPAWKDVDRNGCDTRNDVLRRDLTHVAVKAGTHGCLVLTGTLADPYTGRTIAFERGQATSTAVQIDHVVALMDAWQSGAQQLSQTERESLANDPLNLLAVDGPANAQKGAGNAATWLPPAKGYRCAYVARQITVKSAYRLWVTAPERDAMERILQTCPDQKVASGGTITLMPDAVATTPAPTKTVASKPAPKKTVAPKPAPKKTVAPKPAPKKPAAPRPAPRVVHPGAFCAPLGASGVTVKGTPMRCTSPDGKQARWRAA